MTFKNVWRFVSKYRLLTWSYFPVLPLIVDAHKWFRTSNRMAFLLAHRIPGVDAWMALHCLPLYSLATLCTAKIRFYLMDIRVVTFFRDRMCRLATIECLDAFVVVGIEWGKMFDSHRIYGNFRWRVWITNESSHFHDSTAKFNENFGRIKN